MKTLFEKQINPDLCLGYVHIPKCAGTYIKEKMSMVAEKANLYEYDYSFHEPVETIKGYRTGSRLSLQGAISIADLSEQEKVRHLFLVSVRDVYEWYDSWFYYKKNFKKRQPTSSQPLTPLYHELGDYEKALENSLSDEWIKKISFSVLQNKFCPATWMRTFDVGFYTAWFLYMTADHFHVFSNPQLFKGDKLVENFRKTREDFPGMIFNSKDTDKYLSYAIKDIFGLDYSRYSNYLVENDRKTNYEKGYLKCSQILKNNDKLRKKFLWKERLMISLVNQTNGLNAKGEK